MGYRKLINAMAKSKSKSVRKGLIHVEVGINGKKTRAIVNRGPTHNFISEAKTLGLKPEGKSLPQACPLKGKARTRSGSCGGATHG